MYVMCVNMVMEQVCQQFQAQSCQTVTKEEECEIVEKEDCDDETPMCNTVVMEQCYPKYTPQVSEQRQFHNA